MRSSPERALESLYRRHATDVYRYSLAMLHRQADAEDATQTTFMNAYRALERGEHPRDEGKWLRKIALNVCREQYRRAGRRPDEVSLDEDPGELVPEPSTPSIGDVVRGLHCLPFNQRAALVMREFEGRSLAEIAAALETSTSAVETLLFRGRRALREQLEEQLSCSEAEEAISRQLDGGLPRRERGRLRAHLRACPDCASLARRLRGQRSTIRSLALLPIPASLKLGKLMGGGAASASATATGPSAVSAGGSMIGLLGSAAAKVALVTVAGGAALGVSYESLHGGLSQPPVRGAAKLAALRQSDRQTAASPAPSAPSAASVMRATDPRVTTTRVPARRAKRGTVAPQSSAPRQWRNGQHSSTTAPASQSALVSRGHGRSATNPGQGHLHAAKPSAGSAGSQGSGYAYGQTKPKHTTSTPPSHAYGTVKPKPTKPATPAPPASGLSLHPPQRPLIPRGQAKKQDAAVISHGRGALK